MTRLRSRVAASLAGLLLGSTALAGAAWPASAAAGQADSVPDWRAPRPGRTPPRAGGCSPQPARTPPQAGARLSPTGRLRRPPGTRLSPTGRRRRLAGARLSPPGWTAPMPEITSNIFGKTATAGYVHFRMMLYVRGLTSADRLITATQ